MDNDNILSGLFSGYQYATPEQRKRAQEHAYALLKQPNEKYTSWTQGARDVANALVGRQILNQTNEQESQQLNQGGQSQANLLDEIQRRVRQSAPQSTTTTGSLPTSSTSSIPPKVLDDVIKKEQNEEIPLNTAPPPTEPETNVSSPSKLGGPDPNGANPQLLPQGQQVAQANGIPPAVTAPSAAVNKDNLAKLLANPTISPEVKSKIQEMMIKGATPENRETAQGIQQYRPSNPSETSTPGSAGFSPFSIGDIHTVQRTVVGPDGKPEALIMIPNGKGQWTTLEGIKAWSRDQKSQDEFMGENTKRLGEDYSKYQQLGNSASEQIQNLDLMKRTLNDPNMYTGTGDQKFLDWKKFLVSIGKNPDDRAAPAEVFKKLMAGGVLEGLGQFKGLGQIRVAEIEQLQKSLADTNMTKPAIMAVLNLNQKAHERHVEMANEASAYASTHNDRLDAGWDKHLRDWKKEHPFMTEDQIKNWKEEFAGKQPSTTAPEIKTELGKKVYNPVTRKWE